jgi:hypothetical protein
MFIESKPKYQPYTLRNFRQIPQIQKPSEDQKFAIEVVGHILPFRTNNYVVDQLIDWGVFPFVPPGPPGMLSKL